MNYLVFDLGGTSFKYALMSRNAEIIEKGRSKAPQGKNMTKEYFFQFMGEIIHTYKSGIKGISISMPGMIDSEVGYCRTAGALTYLADIHMARILGESHGIPVSIENDGKCAALAELWKGSLKTCTNGAVIILGTGVGGGIIIDKKLYKGSNYSAGEYSYLVTDDTKKMEFEGYWGKFGGVPGLAKCVSRYTGKKWTRYDGYEIFELINQGDPGAQKGLKEFTDVLAVRAYNLNALLDLDLIAIGGGISEQPLLHEYLKKSIDEYMENHPHQILGEYIPTPKVTHCTFFNDANLIGALYCYLNRMEGQPGFQEEPDPSD